MMTGTLVGHAEQQAASLVTDITVTVPSGSVGDVLVVGCFRNNGTAVWGEVTTTDFTALTATGNTAGKQLFVRTCTGSEAGTYTFRTTVNSANLAVVQIARISGVSLTNIAAVLSAGASFSLILNSVTTPVANCYVISMLARVVAGANSWGPPAGTTERYDELVPSGTLSVGYGDETVAAAGATGSRTWSASGSGNLQGALIAIGPPAPLAIVPGGIASTATVGSPTVTRGSVTIQPTGRASTAALGSPTLARGSVTVSPSGRASTASVGTPTVVPGAHTIAPSGRASTAALGTPTVVAGSVTVQPSGRASSAAVGAPTLTTGPVTITPAGRASTATVGEPAVTTGASLLRPTGIASTATLGTPLVVGAQGIAPTGIASTATMGAPTVRPGAVTLQPSSITAGSTVGQPSVVRGTVNVVTVGIGSTATVGGPQIAPGEVLVRPASIGSHLTLGVPSLSTIVRLSVPGIPSGTTIGVPRVGQGGPRISVPGIASTLRVGEPVVSFPGPADECWPVDLSCVSDWDDLDNEGVPIYSARDKERAIRLAGMTMRLLTGFRVGGCPITVRPCSRACAEHTYRAYPLVGSGAPWTPYVADGEWRNMVCGCAGSCSCGGIQEVELGMPASRVSEVKIDGVVLSPSAYRLDRGGRLVRVDGDRWPTCQHLDRPDTAEGTWSVTYVPGNEVDSTGAIAAGLLAGEYVRACSGGACSLPDNVTQIVRQGVTMQFATGLFPEGRTGLTAVDVYLERWNPGALRAPARVASPDVRRPR